MTDKENVGEKSTNGSKDIGGWLLFFAVVFIILTVGLLFSSFTVFSKADTLQMFLELSSLAGADLSNIEIVPPSPFLIGLEFFVLFFSSVIFVVALSFVFQKKKKGIKWVIVSLWVFFTANAVVNLIDMSWMFPIYRQMAVALSDTPGMALGVKAMSSYLNVISSLMLSAVLMGLLTWYFLKSERVKETLIN